MAHQVIWLSEARDELNEAAAYIAADNPSAAAGLVERILAAARDLADFPNLGPRVLEWDDDSHRQRIVHPYRLIYRVSESTVEVISIWHGVRPSAMPFDADAGPPDALDRIPPPSPLYSYLRFPPS